MLVCLKASVRRPLQGENHSASTDFRVLLGVESMNKGELQIRRKSWRQVGLLPCTRSNVNLSYSYI